MADLCPPVSDVVEATDGQRLFAGIWPGEGPTIVCLPGLTSTHRAFAGVASRLGGRCTVVALDLRGRGNSTKPGPGSYGIARHAADVLAVLDHFGIEQALMTGHSMGAYVASAVATVAPHRATGLVLVDGGVLVDPADTSLDADALLEILLKPIIDGLEVVHPSFDRYRATWTSSPYHDTDEPLARQYLDYLVAPTREGVRAKCSSVAAREDWRDLLTDDENKMRLADVACPILAIAADGGLVEGAPPILGEPQLERLRDQVGDYELRVVENTMHHSILLSDRGAAACAAAIADFAGIPEGALR